MCGSNRRKRSSSTAGAGAAVNDDDLMTEILARLPTKSLLRFGCASKSWSGLISHVWSRRRDRILLPLSGFCFNSSSGMMHYAPISAAAMEDDDDRRDYCRKETAFDSLIISHLPSFFKAITSGTYSSCIGLLLFLSSSSNVHNPVSMVVLSFSVFSLATSELVALPTTPKIRESPVTYLAFDPHKSPHYKVVCFNDFFTSGVATVYSSMTGKWIQLAFRDQVGHFPCHSVAALFVFHDDALHMIDRGKRYLSRFHLKIDEEGEDFLKPIPLPNRSFLSFRQSPSMCIGKSTGRLCLAMNIAQESNLKIWMLESKAVDQYYWSLMHTLCTNVLYANPQPAQCIVNPVAFHPGSAAIVYVSVPGKLLECNLSGGNSKVIYRFTEDANAMITNDIFPVYPYLESIDPPGGKYIRVDRFLPSST